MIRIEQYTPVRQAAWDDLIDHSKSPMFMFKRGFMEYHADRFQDFSLLFFNEKDELLAVLPASRHGDEVRSHGGLTYGGFFTRPEAKQHHINECVSALAAYLKEKGIARLLYKSVPYIYFQLPAEEYLWPLLQQGAQLSRTDIASVIDLQNPLKIVKGRKAQANRAKREGVTIAPSEDYETFIRLENEVLQSRHHTTAVHSAEELKLLKTRFPQNIALWTAQYQGEVIAGALVFIYPNAVHTQYLAANEKAREIGGLDYLIKTLMEHYAADKRWFDFGISTEQAGAVFNDGLCAQKEGFGARSVAYNFYQWEIK